MLLVLVGFVLHRPSESKTKAICSGLIRAAKYVSPDAFLVDVVLAAFEQCMRMASRDSDLLEDSLALRDLPETF